MYTVVLKNKCAFHFGTNSFGYLMASFRILGRRGTVDNKWGERGKGKKESF